jgi:uncharacterized spore protein YtfJ
MNAVEILENIGESLGSTATVKSVFGEPIHAEGETVVPVARVAYGFGAGAGPGRQGEGGGGGGGARVFPAGALEITATQTRFIPFIDLRWLVAAFVAGALCGSLGRRRRSRLF